jgi:hypothetical protein
MCALETTPDRFGPFKDLVECWNRRRGDRRLPARRDFPVEDFAPWMGRIFIARIEPEPFNLRFSLWGTTLTEWWGVDYTNKTLGEESIAPERWRDELAYFHDMARAPFIGVASGYLSQHERRFIRVIGLDMPMGEGGRVTHVLSAHMKIALDASVESVMPDCPIIPHAASVVPQEERNPCNA